MTTETATQKYISYHAEILETLRELESLVMDKPAPTEDFTPNWGHVGDLNHIAAELAAIRDSIRENEAYWKTTR